VNPGEPTIAVYCAATAWIAEALRLAARLSLPLIERADERFDFLLTYTAEHLELRKTGRGAPGPIYVDFARGSTGYRRLHSGRRQLLARAIGMRPSVNPSVIDTTAGLGSDAFMLAWLGCRVLMLERSAIIHALLADGLTRARSDPTLASTMSERLALCKQDAASYLKDLADINRPDGIYLDPMYPERHQSALPKKEMRMLRELAGDDEDAPELLAMALTRARRRVVVKRPRLAAVLKGPPPTVQLKGQTTRYDVYRVED
jgi:16S rRNA (guanine1516-N2)-methyltransferase